MILKCVIKKIHYGGVDWMSQAQSFAQGRAVIQDRRKRMAGI